MEPITVGDAVVYQPHPNARAEEGVVIGLSDNPALVFVRYSTAIGGWASQATPIAALTRPEQVTA